MLFYTASISKTLFKMDTTDHSLNQLLFKSLGDCVTFLRFLKQCRTSDLNNNLYLTANNN